MAGKLAAFVEVAGQWYGPDSDVPADVAKQISNPKAWAEEPTTTDAGDEPEADATEPYRGVTVPELEAEVAARNENRPDGQSIKPAGTKRADLVAALVADDQK